MKDGVEVKRHVDQIWSRDYAQLESDSPVGPCEFPTPASNNRAESDSTETTHPSTQESNLEVVIPRRSTRCRQPPTRYGFENAAQ